MHQMRSRIITSPAFTGERVLGAILFEMTMDRQVEGMGSAEYLWNKKGVVPVPQGRQGPGGRGQRRPADEADARARRPAWQRSTSHGVFGTKMRSVIKLADSAGVDRHRRPAVRRRPPIIAAGLVPIIEPEVDIHSPEKAEAEELLKASDLRSARPAGGRPERDAEADPPERGRLLRRHRRAPSGGPSRGAVRRVLPRRGQRQLAKNHGVIASFSRALTEGLSAQQSDDEFNATLGSSIESIYQASIT